MSITLLLRERINRADTSKCSAFYLINERTVRTPEGAAQQVTVGPETKNSAPGPDRFAAVRSGVTVKVTVEADRRGQLHAPAVEVHPEAKAH